MRWAGLTDEGLRDTGIAGQQALPGAVTRTFDTPGFAGITFYEIHAKSIINKVTGSRMGFDYTLNPYRGCSHACTYCFARNSHTYLDLDSGHDFDSKIVVKVNAVELLRRELRSSRWQGAPVAMGTNVDCYQRAEGRYQLMPGIIGALSEAANPFSILTKGTLILRDLPLLQAAAVRTRVSVAFSIGFLDETHWRTVESGAPSPRRRLDAVAACAAAGLRVSVLMAPILPGLTDGQEQLDECVAELAKAGAASVSPMVLHLRPGAREWYLRWLAEHHPDLVGMYERLYRDRAYASADYQRLVTARVRRSCRRHGIGAQESPASDLSLKTDEQDMPAVPAGPESTQLTLI